MEVDSEAVAEEWKPVEAQEEAEEAPVEPVKMNEMHEVNEDAGWSKENALETDAVAVKKMGVDGQGDDAVGDAVESDANPEGEDANAFSAKIADAEDANAFDVHHPAVDAAKQEASTLTTAAEEATQPLDGIDAKPADAEHPSSLVDDAKKDDANNASFGGVDQPKSDANEASVGMDNSMDAIMAINSAEDKPAEDGVPEDGQMEGSTVFAAAEPPAPSVMEVLNGDVANHDAEKQESVFEEHAAGNTITEDAINSAIASAIAGNTIDKHTATDNNPVPDTAPAFPDDVVPDAGCITDNLVPPSASGAVVVVPPLPASARKATGTTRKKRSIQHVTTLAKRAEIMAWMRAQHTAGQTRIPSKAVAAFPDEFRGSANSRLMKASRYFRLRDSPPVAASSKARPGRGRKKAAWSAALAADVAAEVARLRAAGVRISHEVVKTAACSTLVNRKRAEYAPGLVAKINNRWVGRFVETHPGVLGLAPARKGGAA